MTYFPNQSLQKAFRILETLNLAHGGLTAGEITARTGLPTSTVHRFLQNLRELGYVSWDSRRKLYTVGFSLTLFGNRRLIIERIAVRARPFLRALSSQSGLTVYLGSLEGPHAVVEDRVVPGRALKGAHALGARLDAHAHSLGKALLALMPQSELLRIYDARRLPAHTAHTIANRDRLLRELMDIAGRGYAFDNEELNAGVCGLSCALLNPKGRAICAIGLEGPRQKLDSNRQTSLLNALFSARDKIMEQVK
ncbi:MAG: IclR family transcriptional regulator [Xanthobacteraceae bacterium]|nr:IclR family transcriptional regulator [Xanthobacteraceae bacterium]MBV9630222.1 IclR family transcriptional regulator [Xanthobacteraceae bacterium]